jgi:hypothetical protein
MRRKKYNSPAIDPTEVMSAATAVMMAAMDASTGTPS